MSKQVSASALVSIEISAIALVVLAFNKRGVKKGPFHLSAMVPVPAKPFAHIKSSNSEITRHVLGVPAKNRTPPTKVALQSDREIETSKKKIFQTQAEKGNFLLNTSSATSSCIRTLHIHKHHGLCKVDKLLMTPMLTLTLSALVHPPMTKAMYRWSQHEALFFKTGMKQSTRESGGLVCKKPHQAYG